MLAVKFDQAANGAVTPEADGLQEQQANSIHEPRYVAADHRSGPRLPAGYLYPFDVAARLAFVQLITGRVPQR